MEEKKIIEFWKDGEYTATGGYFVRNEMKTFLQKLVDEGLEPVGIIVDFGSFNIEVIVKE